MKPAPYLSDVADGPAEAGAHWIAAKDGVRLRVAIWPKGRKGTVVIFPGRCEYVEKYGRTAAALSEKGYASAAIDWRGQGMADRLLKNPDIGHVRRFTDYQIDASAMLDLLEAQGLPKPFFLLAHSMGGCIGLRTLTGTHPFTAVTFSAPMWGILIAPKLRQLAKTLPTLAKSIGLGGQQAPTTSSALFFLETRFEDNFLTTDREMWDHMVRQARTDKRFRLGGPSLIWLAEALSETRTLAALPRPDLPALAAVGTEEKIVDPAAIPPIMEDWPGGQLVTCDNAEHELLMERKDIREQFLQSACDLFESARA